MNRSVTALGALLLALSLGGCTMFSGWFKDPTVERKDWGAAEYYNAAKKEFDNGNWESSIKLYEQLESKFPFGRFAQQAQLEVAYANYKSGETANALTAVDRFIKTHPNHQNIDYAMYLKALINFKEDLGPLSNWSRQDLADRDPKAARESFESFKELVNRFPNSRYTEDARDRMAYLTEALARHEIKVARYYLERGAHLAAANRAQGALTRFPTSPIQKDALDILIESYDRMGMAELRDDARKVLAKNYPNDPMVKAGVNRIEKSWWKFW